MQKNHEQTNKKISTNPDGEVGRHVDISAGEVDKGIRINGDKDLARIESKRRKNPGYYREIDRACTFVVPEGVRVLELGCATGRLLAATQPAYGLGIDIDAKQIMAARQIHAGQSELEFRVGDVETIDFSGMEPFDYIIMSDILALLRDVQKTLARLRAVCTPHRQVCPASPTPFPFQRPMTTESRFQFRTFSDIYITLDYLIKSMLKPFPCNYIW